MAKQSLRKHREKCAALEKEAERLLKEGNPVEADKFMQAAVFPPEVTTEVWLTARSFSHGAHAACQKSQ